MTLFFLPHAGGSARSYCSWKRYLPKLWKIVPMEPTGRGSRIHEKFCKSIPECVADLLEKYKDDIQSPYIIFGHSMGSMLATELTKQIVEKGLDSPDHVFLSGRCAVDEASSAFPKFNDKTNDDIISLFLQNGLFMPKTADNEELWNVLAKILCADVRMTEDYYLSPKNFQFPCSIHVFYGKDDPFLANCNMSHWTAYTKKNCKIISYDGGHFYCNDHKENICKEIITAININEE